MPPPTAQQPPPPPPAAQPPAAVQRPVTQAPAQAQQPPAPVPQQPVQAQPPAPVAQPPAGQIRQGGVAPGQPGFGPPPGRANLRDLQGQRQQTQEGNRTVIREYDRTIVREGDRAIIQHDETERFRRFDRNARVEQRGRDTATIIERPGGSRVVTVVDDNGRLVRRSRIGPDGREVIIIDNRPRPGMQPGGYFVALPPPVVRIPRERYILEAAAAGITAAAVYGVLMEPPIEPLARPYSLDEIRYSPTLRERMPRVDLDTITFESGSWEIGPDQAARLSVIANAIQQAIAHNPQEVFLIEGHTDAVGTDVDNLSLSDRRAEAVAVVLTDQFGIPPENLTTQGYGEQNLKIPTEGPDPRNRRVTVRRITPLLAGR
jgi:outer membrane protein OmpA-like peptidoglycan-associated protein